MKKPSSGVGIGLWVAGALAGLYVVGFVLLLADAAYFGGWYSNLIPETVSDALPTIYAPAVEILRIVTGSP